MYLKHLKTISVGMNARGVKLLPNNEVLVRVVDKASPVRLYNTDGTLKSGFGKDVAGAYMIT